jgi:hypothetical protein
MKSRHISFGLLLLTDPNLRSILAHTKHNNHMVYMEDIMALVKKTIELDQEKINRIKIALNAKSEKEALNAILSQFDTEIQLAEVTLRDFGTFEFEEM